MTTNDLPAPAVPPGAGGVLGADSLYAHTGNLAEQLQAAEEDRDRLRAVAHQIADLAHEWVRGSDYEPALDALRAEIDR